MLWTSRRRVFFLGLVAALEVLQTQCQCEHESQSEALVEGEGGVNAGTHIVLTEGTPLRHSVAANSTKNYLYENLNSTAMDQPDRYRKLIISLEPCDGIVYLFVRKTRPCWPNPDTCCRPLPGSAAGIQPPPCSTANYSVNCEWTHFRSAVDGSQDGSPTFFEVDLTSSKYYITVYAPYLENLALGVDRPQYRLLAIADIGAYPRPGQRGHIHSRQMSESQVELTWEPASFVPLGVSSLRNYHVYSSLLLPGERQTSPSVMISPTKVMNTVCGLERNAVQYGVSLTSSACAAGVCSVVISGLVPTKRYMLNIVAESARGYRVAYAGIVMITDWESTEQLWDDQVLSIIGGIFGTIFGIVIIGYLWIVKLYS
mmetsp:Transcript_72529/g.172954  ORF Transcript_72529/g.172954 Transcript_72529/m.172954 type:complete len:371 (+) Transcript_72529:116-1228(+)